MKTKASLLLALTAILAVAACSKKEESAPATAPAAPAESNPATPPPASTAAPAAASTAAAPAKAN
jgi:hypothetical protein